MRKWPWLLLLVLLLFVIRMFFALKTPYLSSDNSYLYARGVEALHDGKLLWYDELGFGGRTWLRSPLFEALVALASFAMPFGLAVKVIPNIFASLLAIPAFLISHELTRHDYISFATAFLVGIVPVFFANTFNHLTPLSLALPLFFLLVWLWMVKPLRLRLFLALLFVFAFVSPLAVVFVFAILVYFVLMLIEGAKVEVSEFELGLFAIFFALWAQFLVYKRAILFHGSSVIWQNIPPALLSMFYTNVSLLQAIVQIGAYPLAEGIYALYKTGGQADRKVMLLLSITLVSGGLLWLKLIDLSTGLMLLGIVLAILLSKWSAMFLQYVRLTKISRFAPMLVCASFVLAFITTAWPAWALAQGELERTISQEEVAALSTLGARAGYDATVFAPIGYGHYVEYFGGLKTVSDGFFLLRNRVPERYRDTERALKTFSETEAVGILDKYNATYVVVPPRVPDIKYGEGKCFKRIHATRVRVYEIDQGCEVRVVR